MDIVGFARIKKDATTCRGAKHPEDFIGKDLRVMEFAQDGGVLVLNPQADAFAMFDKEDILTSFKCGVAGYIITPPDLYTLDQMVYATKCTSRKGGYSPLLANMVISASLHKGTFTDSFLWQNQ